LIENRGLHPSVTAGTLLAGIGAYAFLLENRTMQLAKASAYGVYATLYVARHEQKGLIQGKDIAKDSGIPAQYLLKILQQLSRSRILYSERGRGGGFALAKPAGQITLLEIIEAIEGPVDASMVFRNRPKVSDRTWKKFMAIRNDIAEHTRSKLAKTTIKQLML
jgi:Rrf2 family protein